MPYLRSYKELAPCLVERIDREYGCVCACTGKDGSVERDDSAVVTSVSTNGFTVRTEVMADAAEEEIDYVEIFFYARADVPIALAGRVEKRKDEGSGKMSYSCTFGENAGEKVVGWSATKFLNIHSPRRGKLRGEIGLTEEERLARKHIQRKDGKAVCA